MNSQADIPYNFLYQYKIYQWNQQWSVNDMKCFNDLKSAMILNVVQFGSLRTWQLPLLKSFLNVFLCNLF